MSSNSSVSNQSFLEQIKSDLTLTSSAQEKLEYLIELGEKLEQDETLTHNSAYKVPGCASSTYVKLENNSQVWFCRGYTDSFIVKGYIYIITQYLANLHITEIHSKITDLKDFSLKYQLSAGVLPTRVDAFGRILEFIRTQIPANE